MITPIDDLMAALRRLVRRNKTVAPEVSPDKETPEVPEAKEEPGRYSTKVVKPSVLP